jgi:serine/threonine protein kinase/tetratricopeptide (TPR) repeat protein
MGKLGETEIARIVARAGELGPRERLAYLKAACGDDPEAFDRALLAHDLVTSSPEAEVDEAFWSIDRSGQVLGQWCLRKRIGGGGMSEVYLAERIGEYRHQVAVKLVRPGLVSRADHNRLRAERQILARLNHRNIARLLDGGTTDEGIPYLVMEYVDGLPIDEYCDRNRLTVAQRLALFRGVCAAVHAAHQNLVVHRDLKPSNILVTNDRTLKLLDFGIAKLMEVRDTVHTVAVTHADVRLFTPGHASPEQIRGEAITTTTDVYLLGVLLYELLAGRKPFQIVDMRLSQIESLICDKDPPLPSEVLGMRTAAPAEQLRIERVAEARQTTPARLRRELSGDLDNIVMMAMRKEPARRYASADEMSADIKRHDSGKPVIARRDTLRYRADKFLRRHTMAVAASCALVVMLASVAALLAIQAHRISEQRLLAEQERERSDEIAAFLVDLFKVADPGESHGEATTARELLERGAARIRQDLTARPVAQADMMETIGRVYMSLGLTEQARPQLEGALEMRMKLFEGDHPAKASNLAALGQQELAAGRLDAAQKHFEQALAMNQRLHGKQHRGVAASLLDMGQMLKVKGDNNGAEKYLRESLGQFAAIEGEQSARVSRVLDELAQIMEQRGDPAAAEKFYRRALSVNRAAFAKDHPQTAHLMHNLAVVLQSQNKMAEAGPLFESSLAQLRKVLGEKHPDTIDALGNYGHYLLAAGDVTGAEAVFRRALALNVEVRGKQHAYVGYDRTNLGRLLQGKGDHAAAEAEFRAALAIYKDALPGNHLYVGSALSGLAQSLNEMGRPAQAHESIARALAIYRNSMPAAHPAIATAEAIEARSLALQGQFAKAEPMLIASYERLKESLGESDSHTKNASTWLTELKKSTQPAQ